MLRKINVSVLKPHRRKEYNSSSLVLPPRVMLSDVVAVLQRCRDLSNGDNGKVLTLTNSSVWGSSGSKGQRETDTSSNVPFNTSRCRNYVCSQQTAIPSGLLKHFLEAILIFDIISFCPVSSLKAAHP